MEPSGGNQWQPVANGPSRKPRKQAKTVAVGCDQSPPNLDGKEGVDGSSPSEGSSRSRMVAWVAGTAVDGGVETPVMETIWKRAGSC